SPTVSSSSSAHGGRAVMRPVTCYRFPRRTYPMRTPMLRAALSLCLLVVAAAVLWAGTNVDVMVSGKKLLIKDPAKPEKRRAVYLSKDESFSTAGMDPTVGGARFMLVSNSPSQFDLFQ